MNSEPNTVTFVKVKEDAASSKFPCLECKQLCSGYWKGMSDSDIPFQIPRDYEP